MGGSARDGARHSAQSAQRSLGDQATELLSVSETSTTSVIIPAYNAERYVAAAIDSVLGQSRSAAQIIVVDDGSADGTAAVVERFGDAVIFLGQPNAGVSAAR